MVGIDGEDEKSNLPDNLNKFQVRELFTRTDLAAWIWIQQAKRGVRKKKN